MERVLSIRDLHLRLAVHGFSVAERDLFGGSGLWVGRRVAARDDDISVTERAIFVKLELERWILRVTTHCGPHWTRVAVSEDDAFSELVAWIDGDHRACEDTGWSVVHDASASG